MAKNVTAETHTQRDKLKTTSVTALALAMAVKCVEEHGESAYTQNTVRLPLL